MKRILFITSNRLGDAVISSGVLDMLIRRHPAARVTIACGAVAASYFEACSSVDRIIVVEKRKFDLHWFDLWRHCVGIWWDLVVDLRGSGLSLFLLARRRRVLCGGRRPGPRIGHLAAVFDDRPKLRPVIWTRPEQDRLASLLLSQGRRYLALAPTANWHGKIWPASHFVSVAQDLMKQDFVPVIFYGPGAEEKRRAKQVLDALPGAVDMGGQASLGLVGALLRRCVAFIGNDSGLMHLAAASGIPTLGLFGPSRATEYAPVGRRAHYVSAPGPDGEASICRLEPSHVFDAVCLLMADEG